MHENRVIRVPVSGEVGIAIPILSINEEISKQRR